MYFRGRTSDARGNQVLLKAELGKKILARPPRSFYLSLFQIHIFVIRGAHLARSIIENTCLEGLDRISGNVLTCRLQEGIKAVRLL